MDGIGHDVTMFWKILLSSFHSVSRLLSLDSLSATMFSLPGICTAVIHISCCIHHVQSSLVISLHLAVLPPMLLMYAIAVVLSTIAFI